MALKNSYRKGVSTLLQIIWIKLELFPILGISSKSFQFFVTGPSFQDPLRTEITVIIKLQQQKTSA